MEQFKRFLERKLSPRGDHRPNERSVTHEIKQRNISPSPLQEGPLLRRSDSEPYLPKRPPPRIRAEDIHISINYSPILVYSNLCRVHGLYIAPKVFLENKIEGDEFLSLSEKNVDMFTGWSRIPGSEQEILLRIAKRLRKEQGISGSG